MLYRLKKTQSMAYLDGANYIDTQLIQLDQYILELKLKLESETGQHQNELKNIIMISKKSEKGKLNFTKNKPNK